MEEKRDLLQKQRAQSPESSPEEELRLSFHVSTEQQMLTVPGKLLSCSLQMILHPPFTPLFHRASRIKSFRMYSTQPQLAPSPEKQIWNSKRFLGGQGVGKLCLPPLHPDTNLKQAQPAARCKGSLYFIWPSCGQRAEMTTDPWSVNKHHD